METKSALISMRPDLIVHVAFREKITIGIFEQEENRRALIEITKGKKCPVLYTAGSGIVVTREARENARKTEPYTPVLARALLSSDMTYRLLLAFYEKFYRPIIPLKSFTAEAEALRWLRKFIAGN